MNFTNLYLVPSRRYALPEAIGAQRAVREENPGTEQHVVFARGDPVMSQLIGTGVLTWPPSERRSDRYGYVMLMNAGGTGFKSLDIPPTLTGKRCSLACRVVEIRESAHIGDLFHGVFPRTPKVGDLIRLGIGILDTQTVDGVTRVGLIPVESPDSNQWLDIRALYDCHEQTVELLVEEIAIGKAEGRS